MPNIPVSKRLGSTKNDDTYFNTLSEAMDAGFAVAESRGFTIVGKDQLITGGVGYTEARYWHYDVEKDGKAQRKSLHIVIYRMESGRYELTCYVN